MKAENDLQKLAGTHRPFRVPDGYFEDFTQRLMKQIHNVPVSVASPDVVSCHYSQGKPTRHWVFSKHIALWASAAALIGITFVGYHFIHFSPDTTENYSQELSDAFADEQLENSITLSLFDDYALYEYLTDASY